MRLGIRIVGYLLVGLILAGLCLQLFMAWKSGQHFIGLNVRHQPIGTYSTVAVMVMAAAVGAYALVRRIREAGRMEKLANLKLDRDHISHLLAECRDGRHPATLESQSDLQRELDELDASIASLTEQT